MSVFFTMVVTIYNLFFYHNNIKLSFIAYICKFIYLFSCFTLNFHMKKIYLLPGLMTDESLWSRVLLLLKSDYELIPLDIPLYDDFDKVCEELNLIFENEHINLLGFSLGSYIASYYAIKYEKKVNKLFLLAGSASFINEDEVLKRKQALLHMQSFGFKGLSNKKVLSLIEKKNHTDKELIKTIKNMYNKLGFEIYKKQMELSFKREDISEQLSSLNIPIKLFYSSEDRLFDYKALNKIKSKAKKNITFAKIVGTSHMIPLEEPTILAKEIRNWMES